MTRSPRNGSAAAARPEPVESHPRNGCDRGHVQVFGSNLSTDALRILASITPDELRAFVRRIGCLYGGKDEVHAIRCGKKLDQAARCA